MAILKLNVAVVPGVKGHCGIRVLHGSTFLNGTQMPPTYPAMASDNELISKCMERFILSQCSKLTTAQRTCYCGKFHRHVDGCSSREIAGLRI